MNTLQNLRSYRIQGVSLFDLTVASIGTEFLVRSYTNLPKGSGIPISILMGLLVHWVLGIDTPLGNDLGINSAR